MTSILTNTGAMIALQSLTATQMALTQTQSQISTGLKVQSAKDGAAAWSIATTMKTNIASLGQVTQDLGNADSVLSTAVSGAGQITSLLSQIRTVVQSSVSPSNATSTADLQSQVDQLLNQIDATIKSSSFNGVNLLDGSTASKLANGNTGVSFLAATANDYSGAAATQSSTINVDTSKSNLTTTGGAGAGAGSAMQNLLDLVGDTSTGVAQTTGVSNITNSAGAAYSIDTTAGATLGNLNTTGAGTAVKTTSQGLAGIIAAVGASPNSLDAFLSVIDQASSSVQSSAAQFGAVQTNIESQQTFVKNLSNTLTTGVSNLVDADMTATSARLSALQTQQQLGTQALSIANQAPQMLLKLFG